MKEENGSSKSQPALAPFGGKANYRPIWLLAIVGAVIGIVTGVVLSTSPAGMTAAMYTAVAFGVVGILAGIWYGFFFNISNHCRGGRILWAFIGSVGGAALGLLVASFIFTIVGTLLGGVLGWGIGSLLTSRSRGFAPLVGATAGVVAQALWSDPTTAWKGAALGGLCGFLVGPVFFFLCVALGYLVLRGDGVERDV